MLKKFFFGTIILLFSSFLFLALGEIFLRNYSHLLPNRLLLKVATDERSLLYRYDPLLGWFPRANSESAFQASIRIHVRHNSMGFRDKDHGPKTSPRVAFLGDSFVWGYDSAKEDRFTDRLQGQIPQWDVLNLGVSGYGTDQEYLLLEKYFTDFQPDVVFLMYEDGDNAYDNLSNFVYGGYYKPYFLIEGNQLVLKGVPVPKSATYLLQRYPALGRSYILRLLCQSCFLVMPKYNYVDLRSRLPFPTAKIITEMKQFLDERNVPLFIGMIEMDLEIQSHAEALGLMCVDLIFDKADTRLRFPGFGQHWTAEGNRIVSERLATVIRGIALPQKPT